MSAMVRFAYRSLPLDVRFGRDAAADNLGQAVRDHDAHRVLVVTSASQAANVERLTAQFRGQLAGRFTDVVEHVPAATAAAAVRAAIDTKADLVLSIGGGSSTGTGKAIALRTGLSLVAVPTTLAGSEMTDTWGITTGSRKQTGRDPAVLPRTVIYDPALLTSLPPDLTVASAFNALAHCVEAFWGSTANPLSSVHAEEGVRHLADGLRALKNDAPDALDQLQYGSFLAGLVFAEAGSGLHHKICHALGGRFNLPHAATHAVILPEVLRFTAPSVPATAAMIAAALRDSDAANGLDGLVARTGAPSSLSDIGLTTDQVDLAVDAVAEKLPIAHPREVTRADLARILGAAFERKDPRGE
jgi:maleylacetate reductase